MKINQAEELAGITKKNIRFYEEQGLLSPERNPDNGYREYSLRDVDLLMKIKLFRKLSVPIEEIKLLLQNKLTLHACMEKQLLRFHREQHSIDIMTELCTKISKQEEGLSSLNASNYLSEIKRIEEGGAFFVDIEKSDVVKKKLGSMIAAAVIIGLILATGSFILWANSKAPIPIGIIIFVLLIYSVVAAGILIALKQRLTELNGGEEDEARKY